MFTDPMPWVSDYIKAAFCTGVLLGVLLATAVPLGRAAVLWAVQAYQTWKLDRLFREWERGPEAAALRLSHQQWEDAMQEASRLDAIAHALRCQQEDARYAADLCPELAECPEAGYLYHWGQAGKDLP